MKRGTTLIARIGTALLIVFGLLLIVAGIVTFVSPWYRRGGLLDVKSGEPTLIVIGSFLSIAFGALLILGGMVAVVAGLVTGIIGFTRRGTQFRSIGWLFVGALVVALIALVHSVISSAIDRKNREFRTKQEEAEQEFLTHVARDSVRLDLQGTRIKDAGLKNLKDLKSLQMLSPDSTRFTDAGLKELKDLKSLQTLSLGSTRVTDAGLKELKVRITIELGSTRLPNSECFRQACKHIPPHYVLGKGGGHPD